MAVLYVAETEKPQRATTVEVTSAAIDINSPNIKNHDTVVTVNATTI